MQYTDPRTSRGGGGDPPYIIKISTEGVVSVVLTACIDGSGLSQTGHTQKSNQLAIDFEDSSR